MATSQNGYRANDPSLIHTYDIPGTDRRVSLRTGAPGELLVHWAAWFSATIEAVDKGQLDDWGFAERNIRGSSTTLSNHASGTAIDLNATRHPLGRVGTFTPGQTKRIRAELSRYEGAIRWGGDYNGRKDEMHFEIMASPARCAQVLAKLTAAPTAPARRPAVVTPYDHAYALGAEIIAVGKDVQSKYTARRRYIDGVAALHADAPVPTSVTAKRKAKK